MDGRGNIRSAEALCEMAGPWGLPLRRRVIRSSSLSRQHHQLCASMVWIRGERHQAVCFQVVHCPLDGLTGQPHVPGQVGHWLGPSGKRDCPNHLPTSTGEPDSLRETVASGKQAPIQLENVQDYFCDGAARRRPPG